MKRLPNVLASVAVALALAGAAHAQEVKGLDGDWTGSLQIQGMSLSIVFHIKTAGGKTTATMDSPDQGAFGLEGAIKRDGQKVTIEVPIADGIYQATLSADGKSIVGTWNQPRQLTVTKK